MPSRRPTDPPLPAEVDEKTLQEVLGYLNFSNGKPDPRFQRGFNELFAACGDQHPRHTLIELLTERLESLKGSSPAFEDIAQARIIIPLALEDCRDAYRRYHADLLFHLPDADFDHPFLLVRMVEAVLSQGAPWTETDRILTGAVSQLNDFLGFRPVAVLENERKMQPYANEAFRPVPLYLRDAGVAIGPYRELIEHALQMFEELSPDIQREAYFDRSHLDELAVDVRAYDHLHPVNKRTNYIFGEWDPHLIDTGGYYRRFVVRKIILDALLSWMAQATDTPEEERMFDAAAVLCGTILMASSISGSGPGTHDSAVSLSTLLPKVARQRDLFYAHLLEHATGQRARRLIEQAERTQQPFGHVRQHLNIELSRHGAKQVHDRFLSQFFARMGFPAASRDQAARIPCPAGRFESEISWRLTAAQRDVDNGNVAAAAQHIGDVRDNLKRGIECGAIVDPWNLLGFQGQFPLFQSREDAVPDQRVETLLEFMERFFDVASRALSEAAASGETEAARQIAATFESTADWWSRFATTTVTDLPKVNGSEAWESAKSVADALSQWRNAGESAGDISFWRQHVEHFRSPQAYGRVVETLIQKQDDVAAMGLLMQWLSQTDDVGLSSGGYSLNALLLHWARAVTQRIAAQPGENAAVMPTLRRLFDYLEANAGEYWSVPPFSESPSTAPADNNGSGDEEESWTGDDWELDDDNGLYGAAYEGVVYRDSAEDGNVGETMDGDYIPHDTEIENISRAMEPRLDFLKTLAELWQLAAQRISATDVEFAATDREAVVGWIRRARNLQRDLAGLLHEVTEYPIVTPSGTPDSNIEFDIQTQARYYLMHRIVATAGECRTAEWHLRSLLTETEQAGVETTAQTRRVAAMFRSVIRGDTVEIRKSLPAFLRSISRQPLLYVSLENGGDPKRFLAARSVQTVLMFLLTRLPALGLLYETWQVLLTAFRMERTSRPGGTATTEFDRLLRAALAGSLESVVASSRRWRWRNNRTPRKLRRTAAHSITGGLTRRNTSPAPLSRVRRRSSRRRIGPLVGNHSSRSRRTRFRRQLRRITRGPGSAWLLEDKAGSDAELRRTSASAVLAMVKFLVDRYQSVWLKHSRSVRLSSVELLLEEHRWTRVQNFIREYGEDLLHAPMLMLSNIRAILHQGVDEYLDFLAREHDPLHPIRLLEDIENGEIEREEACKLLELVYESILDKLERFIEYNTTTTQSDYGDQFGCLLDFLRTEAAYDRDAWNLRPYHMAHEVLASQGTPEMARLWEELLEAKTARKAESHLAKLAALQAKYAVHLPSITDHLGERFVKRFAVNRMRALISASLAESKIGAEHPEHFLKLREEIDGYLNSTAGSAIEVPDWLVKLDREVEKQIGRPAMSAPSADSAGDLLRIAMRPRQALRQFARWKRRPRRSRP